MGYDIYDSGRTVEEGAEYSMKGNEGTCQKQRRTVGRVAATGYCTCFTEATILAISMMLQVSGG